MSKFEEKKYKQTLTDDTPDLWAKIDSKLDDSLFTTDSAPNMDMKPKKSNLSPKKKTLKPSKVYKIAGIIAACLAIIIIPIAIKTSSKQNEALTKDAAIDSILSNAIGDNNSTNKEESFDSINGQDENSEQVFDTSNGAVTSDNISGENTHIGDHTSKEYANIDDKTTKKPQSQNTSEGQIKLPSNEDKDSSNDSSSSGGGVFIPKGEGGEHLKNGQIHYRIDSIHNDPKLGLIYKGTATASKDSTIAPECIFYLSLKELSKTDLGKKLNVGDKITISLKDTSYAACLDNPYYATSIIYK